MEKKKSSYDFKNPDPESKHNILRDFGGHI